MEEIKKLNDEEMEQAAGGKLAHTPNNVILKEMGLSDIVVHTYGITDEYYDTYREETKTWKNVGSEDMLKYVERTLGADDERYKKLCDFVKNGDNRPIKLDWGC